MHLHLSSRVVHLFVRKKSDSSSNKEPIKASTTIPLSPRRWSVNGRLNYRRLLRTSIRKQSLSLTNSRDYTPVPPKTSSVLPKFKKYRAPRRRSVSLIYPPTTKICKNKALDIDFLVFDVVFGCFILCFELLSSGWLFRRNVADVELFLCLCLWLSLWA